MKHVNLSTLRKAIGLLVLGLLSTFAAQAQLPTAAQVAANMTVGWNIGNSLEVPGDETAWGNAATTQTLIDAVKAAGFNTVRIPCAWDSYANASTHQISATWLARVKQVVDYCINNNMYVIINIHWDGGWLEEHPVYSMQASVNLKQEAYWTQIANYFKSYDEHLLFAGTNEVHADYSDPSTENIEVQQSFNQVFVDAVRATGGNNGTRSLIVQTYNTNMWHGLNYFSLPTDQVSDRLMVETHFYDPYDFCLNTDNSVACTAWGQNRSGVCSWGQEAYVEDLFAQMKNKFSSKGVPIIIGEFGVIKRTSLTGSAYSTHIASREYFFKYITDAALRNGMVPVYWDNGYNGDNGMALFNRSTGAIVDQGAVDALMEGAGITGETTTYYTLGTSVSGSGSISLSPSGGTYQAGTTVTVTATPASGYTFSGYSGDLSGTATTQTITMSGNKSVAATFAQQTTGGSGSGTILREYWLNVTGAAIADLTANANYPNSPSGSQELSSLEGPTNWNNYYGSRIRGYVHAPASGSYTFWVAGDDNVNLYLSTNETAANASLIASVSGWTDSRQWDKFSSQQSAAVYLVAGQKYYIEVLHKEGKGGDNLAVAWQGPGMGQAVIDGSYLSPFDASGGGSTTTYYTLDTSVSGSGSISLSPAGGTYQAGTVVTATANANSGYTFDGWSGNLSGSSTSATITMSGNRSITASFSATQSGGGGATCTNATTVSVPFVKQGAGEYCYATTADIAYINSWGMDALEINGVDFTNVWANTFPAKINGYYYIYYSSTMAWSHFEAPQAKLAKAVLAQNAISLYPNPFSDGIKLATAQPENITALVVIDQLGRTVYSANSIAANMPIGQGLEAGVYIVQILYVDGSTQNRTIIKK